jgi:hypothetical protein
MPCASIIEVSRCKMIRAALSSNSLYFKSPSPYKYNLSPVISNTAEFLRSNLLLHLHRLLAGLYLFL